MVLWQREKAIHLISWCSSKSLTSLQASQRHVQVPEESRLAPVNESSAVGVQHNVGGYTSEVVGVWYRELFQDTAAEKPSTWRRSRARSRLKEQEAHLQKCAWGFVLNRCTYTHKQTSTFLPASSSSGWWLFQERTQHQDTHCLQLYPVLLPSSSAHSFSLAFLVTSPHLFYCHHFSSSHFNLFSIQIISPNFTAFLRGRFIYFFLSAHLVVLQKESCLADKVAVS